METLLSLTSKRAGDWFKEELRLLGGLDHIVDKGGCKRCSKSLHLCVYVGGSASQGEGTAVNFHVTFLMGNGNFSCVCVVTVKECVQNLNEEDDKENLVASLWGAERCLRVLESVSTAAFCSLIFFPHTEVTLTSHSLATFLMT